MMLHCTSMCQEAKLHDMMYNRCTNPAGPTSGCAVLQGNAIGSARHVARLLIVQPALAPAAAAGQGAKVGAAQARPEAPLPLPCHRHVRLHLDARILGACSLRHAWHGAASAPSKRHIMR